jgi:hypothetical protein
VEKSQKSTAVDRDIVGRGKHFKTQPRSIRGDLMKVGDFVMDHEMGMNGILLEADDFYPELWHIYYEDGEAATAFENALEVISESR